MRTIENEDKLISAAAYLFFIPALYIILTDKRKVGFNAHHAAQALLLWIVFAAVMVLLRFFLGLASDYFYYPLLYFKYLVTLLYIGLVLFLAGKCIYGRSFELPFLGAVVKYL